MNVTVKANRLSEELGIAVRIMDRKVTVPIAQYALFEPSGDGEVVMYATDLDLTVRSAFPGTCDALAGGAFVMPGRRLQELAAALPGDTDVRIEVGAKALTVQADNYHGKIQTLPADDFPKIPDVPKEMLEVPAAAVRDMVRQVKSAIIADDKRYFLNGAKLEVGGRVARMVTTDSHRLAVAEANVEHDGALDVLVPAKALQEVSAMADVASVVRLAVTENKLFVQAGSRTLMCRLVEASFPAWERVLSATDKHDKHVVISRPALLGAVRRVALVGDRQDVVGVQMDIADGKLTVSAAGTDVGEADEQVECQHEGGPVKVKLNAKYLADALEAATSAEVGLDLRTDGHAVMLIQQSEQASFRYLIMPMRL